mgnify:CR=1 FL=1
MDINGKQNDLVHIDGVKTFQVPKLGDPKMKKLTPEEILQHRERETALATKNILESLEKRINSKFASASARQTQNRCL